MDPSAQEEGFPRRALLQLAGGFVAGAAAWHLWPHDPMAVLNPMSGVEDPLSLHPELKTPKQAGEVRVLFVGASLTFGYPYGLKASFAAILEAGLRAVFPDRRILVKAIAKPAIDSTRIAAMVEAGLAAEPDAIWVVVGGNEVGARLFLGRSLMPDGLLERLGDHGTRSRSLFQALGPEVKVTSAVARGDDFESVVGRLLDARPGRPIVGGLPVSRADRAELAQRARTALRRMAAVTHEATIPLVFCQSPYDLAGAWPRGMSEVAPAVDRAVLAWQMGTPPLPAVLDALLRLHPDRADVHSLHGRVLLADRDHAAARAAFVRARDLDSAPLHIVGEVEAVLRAEGEALGVPVLTPDAGTFLPGTEIQDPACFLDPAHWNLDGAQRAATWFATQLAARGVIPALPDGWRETFDAAATAYLDAAVDRAQRRSAVAEMARGTAAYHMLFGNVRDAALPLADGVEWLAIMLPGPEATVWVDWAARLTIATAGAGNRIDELFGGTPEAKNMRAIALSRAMWDAARAGRLRAYVSELIGGAAFP